MMWRTRSRCAERNGGRNDICRLIGSLSFPIRVIRVCHALTDSSCLSVHWSYLSVHHFPKHSLRSKWVNARWTAKVNANKEVIVPPGEVIAMGMNAKERLLSSTSFPHVFIFRLYKSPEGRLYSESKYVSLPILQFWKKVGKMSFSSIRLF